MLQIKQGYFDPHILNFEGIDLEFCLDLVWNALRGHSLDCLLVVIWDLLGVDAALNSLAWAPAYSAY